MCCCLVHRITVVWPMEICGFADEEQSTAERGRLGGVGVSYEGQERFLGRKDQVQEGWSDNLSGISDLIGPDFGLHHAKGNGVPMGMAGGMYRSLPALMLENPQASADTIHS